MYIEKIYVKGKTKFVATKKKIMRKSTLWNLINKLENGGAHIEVGGYSKSMDKELWIKGYNLKKAQEIARSFGPYSSFPMFNIIINDVKFQIKSGYKFPAIKISVESDDEVEARNQLEKILKEYIK
jgi:hypothetical protein